MAADRPTRFAADLLDAAAIEGARQSRSAKQQLDHWARVGRSVTLAGSASRRRIDAVMAGTLPRTALRPEERAVVDAELEVAVTVRAGATDFGDVLAARGVTTVALDDAGALVEYRPDGTSTVLEPAPRDSAATV